MRGGIRFAALVAALLSASAAAAPVPPTLLSPPDDPNQDHCFAPDPAGIKLRWRPQENAPNLATYIEIRRGNRAAGTWQPWVKKYAHPPFTLNVRPSTYDAVFAWRVWTVDRSGKAQPYATPSPWWLFCTKPRR